MNKQKEIREGIWQTLRRGGVHIAEADALLEAIFIYLHSQGVVIKVDRELPVLKSLTGEAGMLEKSAFVIGVKETQEEMLKAGYVATESLIKEE